MYLDENIKLLGKNPLNSIGEALESDFTLQYIGTREKIDFFEDKIGRLIKVEDCFEDSNQGDIRIRQMVFAFGINSPNELNKLYRTLNRTSVLIVIEPNPTLFNVALNTKKLKVFENDNVILFANKIEFFQAFLLNIMSDFYYFSLVNNTCFYLTDYYRNYDFEITRAFIKNIRQNIKSQVTLTGNSIEDGLEGLENNFNNILYMLKSKNPHFLKDKYKDKPAIVIAAGPSLEKNIEYLKQAEGKAIILAVDTVIKKVLKMGITPDFVCSLERIPEVYDYFYKDTIIPEKVTLVGPLLLDSRIFEEYKGNWILPYRTEVAEYKWLRHIMKATGHTGMLMGTSCAHVAFGMAQHLGASPIILIGQDLAYGEDESNSHVSDTIYDTLEKKPQVKSDDYIEGYYGGQVKTTDIWLMFKTWYEKTIDKYNLNVINATEGGAKIGMTIQMSFKEAIDKYCNNDIDSVYSIVESIPTYEFSKIELQKSFEHELAEFKKIREEAEGYIDRYNKMEINGLTIRDNLNTIQKELDLFDLFVQKSTSHPLMIHNIQGFVLKTSWDLSSIEDVISVDTLSAKKAVHIKFLIVIISTIQKIEKLFELVINKIKF
ncbi:motility associated factor glycosyltransferase family protein [Caryophanon latum]|uniref:6-hydroxymethylpterin diphosphokinase MptE-like domain-containing protein n=1 Tax=Caryophanon latum TaxID=33977 RepID=A0A1C0YR43_9BACL|nr:6-hydroxymethylpterin diphosphokinase MptE-like protein [Caryophanon latum]OCS89626.1 hypothetical protein A6K76_12315 [Caryophanon latum]